MRAATLVLAAALAAPLSAGTLSLSPAAVPLGGAFGASTRQTLTLTNGTGRALAFVLEAVDVSVDGGRRRFVPAGELPGSIAATAVFSRREVTVPPGESASVDVTLTVPRGAAHRAVVALFRGTTPVEGTARASLGTLLTFGMGGKVSLRPGALAAAPPSAARNASVALPLENDGAEPLVAKGLAAILDAGGAMVGKVPLESRRLLPAERGVLAGEFAGELPRGRYRVVATVSYEGRAVTRAGELVVP